MTLQSSTEHPDRAEPDPHERLTGFLARLTRLLLRSSGEGAEQIEQSVAAAARAGGGRADLVVLPEAASLIVTSHGRTTAVNVRGFPEVYRLDRVAALKPALADLQDARITVAQADRRLAAIAASPPPYPWWLRTVGIVLFSVGFAPLIQPTWYEIWTTAVLATISAALAIAADRQPRLAAVLPLMAAAAVSLVALEAFARSPEHGGPVLLMLPALFYFVPGDYLSASAAEMAAGFLTTGAIRLTYSVFLLLQLYVGILLGLVVTGRPSRDLYDVATPADLPRWALFLAFAVFTLGTTLAFAIPRRLLPTLLLLVYLTVGVQTAATQLIGEIGAIFASAVILGFAATLLSRRPHQPPRLILILPGFFTLTVGSLGLRGLTALAGGYQIQGFQDLTKMITIVIAIAVGLLLGTVIAQAPTPDAQPSSPDI
jgi:uncharacterized membrane protein YjjP (DUF1212 family)